ncbi:unnamed protein product [Phyllotreta striolata]|uniref:Uncharacterized protein n=1 Tax=Phyllotreta striolata TaxID=444603 RepID=A0A9N9XQQ5_PHYSR|nr:unnamed protein product [Phyllotreta striolata]
MKSYFNETTNSFDDEISTTNVPKNHNSAKNSQNFAEKLDEELFFFDLEGNKYNRKAVIIDMLDSDLEMIYSDDQIPNESEDINDNKKKKKLRKTRNKHSDFHDEITGITNSDNGEVSQNSLKTHKVPSSDCILDSISNEMEKIGVEKGEKSKKKKRKCEERNQSENTVIIDNGDIQKKSKKRKRLLEHNEELIFIEGIGEEEKEKSINENVNDKNCNLNNNEIIHIEYNENNVEKKKKKQKHKEQFESQDKNRIDIIHDISDETRRISKKSKKNKEQNDCLNEEHEKIYNDTNNSETFDEILDIQQENLIINSAEISEKKKKKKRKDKESYTNSPELSLNISEKSKRRELDLEDSNYNEKLDDSSNCIKKSKKSKSKSKEELVHKAAGTENFEEILHIQEGNSNINCAEISEKKKKKKRKENNTISPELSSDIRNKSKKRKVDLEDSNYNEKLDDSSNCIKKSKKSKSKTKEKNLNKKETIQIEYNEVYKETPKKKKKKKYEESNQSENTTINDSNNNGDILKKPKKEKHLLEHKEEFTEENEEEKSINEIDINYEYLIKNEIQIEYNEVFKETLKKKKKKEKYEESNRSESTIINDSNISDNNEKISKKKKKYLLEQQNIEKTEEINPVRIKKEENNDNSVENADVLEGSRGFEETKGNLKQKENKKISIFGRKKMRRIRDPVWMRFQIEKEESSIDCDKNLEGCEIDFDEDKIYMLKRELECTYDESSELSSLYISLPFEEIPDLHVIKRASKPTKEQSHLAKLLNAKTGPFSKEEDEKIRRNWKEFCQSHHLNLEPRVFFKFPRCWPIQEKIKFLQYLSHGLDNRAPYRVHMRFKKIFEPPGLKKGRYTKEEDDIIINYLSRTNSSRPFFELGLLLNRSSKSVEERHYLLSKDNNDNNGDNNVQTKRIKWDVKMAERLIKAIMEITKTSDVSELEKLRLTDVQWKKVSGKMADIPVKKLRRAWDVNVYPKLFMKDKARKVQKRLIKILIENNENDFRTVSWEKYVDHFRGVTATKLYDLFRSMMHNVSDSIRTSLTDVLKYLLENMDSVRTTAKRVKYEFENGKLRSV